MEESYTSLPTSHMLGSVPAVIPEEKATTTQGVPGANLQIFPPNRNGGGGGGGGGRGGGGGGQGYQTLAGPSGGDGQQSANNWQGFFSVSSYTQYFNVDTDDVINRITSSLYPTGDFFSKIDANPDLYGLVWISTTLIFAIAALGNCASYLMLKRSDSATLWTFDVNYVNFAAVSVYGYVVLVPLAFYFLLQYLGSNVSLVRFWCMWGYSLFIFILSSFLLVIPVEFLRWLIVIITGAVSAAFVVLNLKSYVEVNDLSMVLAAACVLQVGLSIFIKMWFFA